MSYMVNDDSTIWSSSNQSTVAIIIKHRDNRRIHWPVVHWLAVRTCAVQAARSIYLWLMDAGEV